MQCTLTLQVIVFIALVVLKTSFGSDSCERNSDFPSTCQSEMAEEVENSKPEEKCNEVGPERSNNNRGKCVFCRIYDGKENSKILYQVGRDSNNDHSINFVLEYFRIVN